MIPDPDREVFRILLIDASSGLILMASRDRKWLLPRIDIPRWSRAASQILEGIQRAYHLNAVILDEFEHTFPVGSVIVAEAVAPSTGLPPSDHAWKRLTDLAPEELRDDETGAVSHLLSTGATERGPFSRLRWIDDVLTWSTVNIDAKLEDIRVRQINGARNSVLLRLDVRDGRSFWFKSVGDSEYPITRVLARLLPEYLPTVVAHHDEWQAWLMEDAGLPLEGLISSRPRLVEELGRQLARLHRASEPAIPLLLEGRADDQRTEQLYLALPAILDGIGRHNGRLRHSRASLRSIENSLNNILARLDELQIPDALVHGDLNNSNILIDEGTCVFTDWARSSVGNPIANLAQLSLQILYDPSLSNFHSRLIAGYQRGWEDRLSRSQVEHALKLMRPVLLCMYLHARRDWFVDERTRNPDFGRFAHNMSRQLERAVLELESSLAITG